MSKHKAFVIDGNRFERTGFLDRMKKAMGPHETFVFGDDDSYDFVTQLITELNVFDDRHRLFILNDLPYYKRKDEKRSETRASVIAGFVKTIPSIPFGNTVVFNNIEIGVKKFLEVVKEHGEVQEFAQKFKMEEAQTKVLGYFTKRGKTMHREDAELFVNLLSENNKVDIDMLRLALLKIENYVGSRTKVLREDIFLTLEHSEKFIVWNLYNLLDKKDYHSSMKLVENYLRSLSNDISGVIEIIYSMMWRYAALVCIKSGQGIKLSSSKIIVIVSSMLKLKREGKFYDITMFPDAKKDKEGKIIPGEEVHSYSEDNIKKFIDGWDNKSVLEEYTLAHLYLIYYALIQAWSKIRFGSSESERMSIVQIIILLICGKIKNRSSLITLENVEIQAFKNFTLGKKYG